MASIRTRKEIKEFNKMLEERARQQRPYPYGKGKRVVEQRNQMAPIPTTPRGGNK